MIAETVPQSMVLWKGLYVVQTRLIPDLIVKYHLDFGEILYRLLLKIVQFESMNLSLAKGNEDFTWIS